MCPAVEGDLLRVWLAMKLKCFEGVSGKRGGVL